MHLKKKEKKKKLIQLFNSSGLLSYFSVIILAIFFFLLCYVVDEYENVSSVLKILFIPFAVYVERVLNAMGASKIT